ncbi:MAG: M20/M25/M40 family metallo-hydrolase [Planctomycetia bacterium]|nr:M20/M25/M40 family metallo-hydrolase [Planctomycetia bacterium]
MKELAAYIEQNRVFLDSRLVELVRIPSVSSQTAHDADSLRAADWLVNLLTKAGFDAQAYPTDHHPIVVASSPKIDGAPTLLIYGHYDVQPVEDDGSWKFPPFDAFIQDDVLYGRGASDDKGPLMAHIFAAEYWMKYAANRPQLNVKFMLEGDEEGNSDVAARFVREHADLLACDYLALSDSPQFAPGQPAITVGFRGIAYYQIRLFGPANDLHSGMYGGAITNPCNALAKLLGSLVDAHGRITVPEFYDDIVRPSEAEQIQVNNLPFDAEQFYNAVGVTEGSGEEGETILSRIWTRPSFDIHGLSGGYQGEGSKTVLPATASAKFSFRLVTGQNPASIVKNLRSFLASQIPPGIRMELESLSSSPAVSVDTSLPCMKAAARAVEFGFGCSPLFIREGGSVPIISVFSELLTPNIVMLGLSQKTDNAHGPNEHFSMTDFYRGLKAAACLWRELSVSEPFVPTK